MKLKLILLFCVFNIFLIETSTAQITYQQMMDNPSFNFYEVCAAADSFFAHNSREKGSGYTPYLRWKQSNEYKYYPTGIRSDVDPYLVSKAYSALRHRVGLSRLFDNGWQELGPVNVDSITGHYNPGLGRVEAVYVDPNDSLRVYLGSRSGGFWKTTNGGMTWSSGLTDTLFVTGVNTIAVSPTNPNHILINARNSDNGTTHGIYRSLDGGNTWSLTNFNPTILGWGGLGTNNQIFRIAFHPTIPDMIYIGSSKGIYRSTDNLVSWTQLYSTADITDIQFHPTNPSIVYLYDNFNTIHEDIVLRSVDTGRSYSLSNPITGNLGRQGHISVSNACSNCVYFGSDNGIWQSKDNGINFSFLSDPPYDCDGFAVNSLDTSKMVCGAVDAYTSSDGGRTFNQVSWWSLGSVSFTSGQYVHADIRFATSVQGKFYLGTDGLVSRSSDNGTTWSILSKDIGIRENYCLGLSQSNHNRTICGSQDNGTSIKTESNWLEFYGADGMEGVIHPLNDDWMMGSVQYGNRRVTYDGGFTQSDASVPLETGAWVTPLLYDPNHQMHLYSFEDSVSKSEDFGASYVKLRSPGFPYKINEAAMAENNSNVWVVSQGAEIKKTIDGGNTYIDIKGTLPSYYITDIAFDPKDDSTIVVTYGRFQNDGSKIYISFNQGSTWQNITYNLGNMPILSVVIDHSSARNIYLGAAIGVYSKSMSASTWTLYNRNLPNCSVEELEINYGSNTLRAATWGRGLWQYSLMNRENYPAITTTSITDRPTLTSPKFDRPQKVTSTIHYDNTVTSAYVKWSIDTATFDSTILMSNIRDTTWESITAFPLLPVGTNIYFKVFVIGSSLDTTETYQFMYTIYPYTYCIPTYASGCGGTGVDAITRVRLGVLDNTTSCPGAPYYSFYDSLPQPNLNTGSLQTLRVSFGTDPYQYYGVWIDYNQDADFDETNEFVASNTVTVGSSGTATINFTVPLTATLGTTRMRVRGGEDYLLTNTPCYASSSGYGEAEDYLVSITATPCANTSSSINRTSCFTYTLPSGSKSLTVSGVYKDTIPNFGGCDSFLTINLTIDTVNINVTTTSTSLTASATPATFKWLDCNALYAIIPGASAALFTPTVSGNYAVQVTQNSCVDSSECFSILINSIENSFKNNECIIFPNPSSSVVFIKFKDEVKHVDISLIDKQGKQVKYFKNINTSMFTMDINDVANGSYLIEINDGKNKISSKIIKNN